MFSPGLCSAVGPSKLWSSKYFLVLQSFKRKLLDSTQIMSISCTSCRGEVHTFAAIWQWEIKEPLTLASVSFCTSLMKCSVLLEGESPGIPPSQNQVPLPS